MSAPVKSLENWSSSSGGGGAIALNISIHYSKQKFHCSRDSDAMLLLYLMPLRAPNHWQRRRNLEMVSLVFRFSSFWHRCLSRCLSSRNIYIRFCFACSLRVAFALRGETSGWFEKKLTKKSVAKSRRPPANATYPQLLLGFHMFISCFF